MSRNWCFVCEKEFILKNEIQKSCPNCHQDAYEQITALSHPELFKAYQSNRQQRGNSNQRQQPQQQQQQQQQQPNLQQGLMQPFMGLLNTFQNVAQTALQGSSNQNQRQSVVLGNNQSNQFIIDFLTQAIPQLSNSWPQIVNFTSQITNILMQNLINSGQNFRRATQAEISALERISNPTDCVICQGSNHSTEGYRLKCRHQFHVECITPWFERANTCPSCRDSL